MLIHICHYVSLLPFIDTSDFLVSDTVIDFLLIVILKCSFLILKFLYFLFINFIRFSNVNIFFSIFISFLVILVQVKLHILF